MNFYTTLSKYYDSIFKLSSDTKNFINSYIKNTYINALEIGCGTGNLSIFLHEKNLDVTAIDLDTSMIDICRDKNKNIKFKYLDMKDINNEFSKDSFDMITSTGNTLVHLTSLLDIKCEIQKFYDILKPSGRAIIQIINYDNIFKNNVTDLPLIENENIKFTRSYSFENENDSLIFSSTIFEKSTNNFYISNVKLFPLMKDDLENICINSGFKILDNFGDFKKNKYTTDSYHNILVLEKN